MQSFRTEITIPKSDFKIGFEDRIMSIGSCFTENIGQKLIDLKFRVDQNPFGILYNPFSILNCFEKISSGYAYTAGDLILQDGLWHSLDHHGRFSNSDIDQCLEGINTRLKESLENFRSATKLIITFGTAWVYHHVKTDRIVANCHKIPSGEFNRFGLNVKDIDEGYTNMLDQLFDQNANLKVIFTVSPVRHLKDGFVENQKSKSAMIQAIHQLVYRYRNVTYFPSYEIMMDDLRDYRFYKEDRVHPSDEAIEYIWDKFSDTYFTDSTSSLIKRVHQINRAMRHRPLHENSAAFQRFKADHFLKVKDLENEFDFLDWKEELRYFSE